MSAVRVVAKVERVPPKRPEIGKRFVGHFVERRDTLAGTFEQVLPPIQSESDIQIQRALLSKPRYWFTEQRINEARTAVRNIKTEKS